jgi:RimJ/RimL family protein N-acetyltransferase
MIPIIDTERLMLIPPSIDCFEVYEEFYTDAEASKTYGGPINAEQVWARLKADLGSWYLLGFGVWVIQQKLDNSLVGTCGFWQGKGWPRELTWWLLPEARGQGIAKEASKAVLLHAYRIFQWESVETYMNDDNLLARSLVERIGGIKNRRLKFPDGLSRDVYVFPKPA